MPYDLIVRGARLHRAKALVDVAVQDGVFARIAPDLSGASAAREIDAQGRLVTPPFIDAHVHLDAALTVGAAPLQPQWHTVGGHPDLGRA